MSFSFLQWKFYLPSDAGRIRQEAPYCLLPNKIRKQSWKVVNRIPSFSLRDMVNIAKFILDRSDFSQFKLIKEVYYIIDHYLEILNHVRITRISPLSSTPIEIKQ